MCDGIAAALALQGGFAIVVMDGDGYTLAGDDKAAQQGLLDHLASCDVFKLKDGKVGFFHCHTAATVLFAQLGILGNIGAAPLTSPRSSA